jgi:hypothetical protein
VTTTLRAHITRLIEHAEGLAFDAAYALLFPAAAWWIHHGLQRPDIAEELTGPQP